MFGLSKVNQVVEVPEWARTLRAQMNRQLRSDKPEYGQSRRYETGNFDLLAARHVRDESVDTEREQEDAGDRPFAETSAPRPTPERTVAPEPSPDPRYSVLSEILAIEAAEDPHVREWRDHKTAGPVQLEAIRLRRRARLAVIEERRTRRQCGPAYRNPAPRRTRQLDRSSRVATERSAISPGSATGLLVVPLVPGGRSRRSWSVKPHRPTSQSGSEYRRRRGGNHDYHAGA